MKRVLISLAVGIVGGLFVVVLVLVAITLAAGGIENGLLAIGQNTLIITAAFVAMAVGSGVTSFFVLKGEKAPAQWQVPGAPVAPKSGKVNFWTQVILWALAFTLVIGLIVLATIVFGRPVLVPIALILLIIGALALVWFGRNRLRGLWGNEGIRFLAIAVVVTFTLAWAVLGAAYFLAGLGWLNQRIFAGFEMGLVEAAIFVALYHLNRMFSVGLAAAAQGQGYSLSWGKILKKRLWVFLGALAVGILVMTLINDQLWQFGILAATGLAGAAFISWRYAAEEGN